MLDNFKRFPKLTTERLVLRKLKAEDINEIYALRSDERVNKFLARPETKTIEEALQFIEKINEGITQNGWIYWAIVLKNKNILIGTICFWNISKEDSKAEIGYELLPEFQGMGIMQEALSKVIEFGFGKMKLKTIEACMDARNEKSKKLLERNNFRRGEMLKNETENEGKGNLMIYILMRKE